MRRIQFSDKCTEGPKDHVREVCSSGKPLYPSFIVALMPCFSYKGTVAHPVLLNKAHIPKTYPVQ